MGQEIDPSPYWWKAGLLSPIHQPHSKNDDENDDDSNVTNNEPHDLAMLLLPH